MNAQLNPCCFSFQTLIIKNGVRGRRLSTFTTPFAAGGVHAKELRRFTKSDDVDSEDATLTSARKKEENSQTTSFFETKIEEPLRRSWSSASKQEVRADATLASCYVLCRFLVYDLSTGLKPQPYISLQDIVLLSGTFSSAAVLSLYYVAAGLLTRSYEGGSRGIGGTIDGRLLRAVVNVALCVPPWLVTEHSLGFGPIDIGGDTMARTISSAFGGFGALVVTDLLLRELG